MLGPVVIAMCALLLIGCSARPSEADKAAAMCAGIESGPDHYQDHYQDHYELAINTYYLAPDDQPVPGGNRAADALNDAATGIDRGCPQHWRHAEQLRGMARVRH